MKTKKYEPVFQMIANSILDLSLKNSMISLDDTQDLDREFSVVIKDLSVEDHEEYKSAGLNVEVNVRISEKGKEDPKAFELSVLMGGVFQADISTNDEELTEKLKVNGVAALYSIARGTVTNISSQALVSGKVILPLVNFVEFAQDYSARKDDE